MSDLAGLRVLAVEDEPIVAMCLEDLLTDLGCIVLGPAARLEEAVALLAAGPQAAVLDINLGDSYSYPIADALVGAGVPFVFASGYDRVDTAAYPHAPLIQKPYGAGQVAAALRAVLARDSTPRAG